LAKHSPLYYFFLYIPPKLALPKGKPQPSHAQKERASFSEFAFLKKKGSSSLSTLKKSAPSLETRFFKEKKEAPALPRRERAFLSLRKPPTVANYPHITNITPWRIKLCLPFSYCPHKLSTYHQYYALEDKNFAYHSAIALANYPHITNITLWRIK